MKRHINRRFSVAILAICMSLLVGCGDDGSTSANTSIPKTQSDGVYAKSDYEDVEVENKNEDISPDTIIKGEVIDLDMTSRMKAITNNNFTYEEEYKNDNDEWNKKAVSVNDLEYKELDSGTICITGYKGSLDEVVIPSRIDGKIVIEVDNLNVKKLIIPDTVVALGTFENNTTIEEIEYEGTLTYAGNGVFEGTKLKEKYSENGMVIFGNALFQCEDTESETIVVPEGIVTIGSGAFPKESKTKKIILPSTLKYIRGLFFPRTIESVEINSEFELITSLVDPIDKAKVYLNEIDDEIYTFGNVLVYCNTDDEKKDIVIPAYVNRAVGGCFMGKAHSLRFETESEFKFYGRFVPFTTGCYFNVKEIYFPQNMEALVNIAPTVNLLDVEKMVLPENLKYFNGSWLDICQSFDGELPETVEIYICKDDDPPVDRYDYPITEIETDLTSQKYAKQVLDNGGTVILHP